MTRYLKTLNIGEWTFEGYSRGGDKTGIVLLGKGLKIHLDAGFATKYEPDCILITHGHLDHIQELNNLLVGNNDKMIDGEEVANKVKVITMPDLIPLLQDLLNAQMRVNAGQKKCSSYMKSKGHPMTWWRWNPLAILKDSMRLVFNKQVINITPYNMDHSVDTLGFGISEIRKKRKLEYESLDQSECNKSMMLYKNTKDEKYNITEEKEYPIVLFCGDTGPSILPTLPFSKYPIVFIEASFLDPEHKTNKKHLHINDLVPYFTHYDTTTFVLIHFSRDRYTDEEIKVYQLSYEEKYKNVKFFI